MAFVILTFPRCGTHMLRTALDKHPDLTCHNEVFNTDVTPEETIREQGAEKLYDQYTGPGEGFVFHGYNPFETFTTSQLSQPAWDVLLERQPTIIALDRKNLLRRCFSVYQGLATNRWHEWKSQQGKTKQASPRLKPNQVAWQIRTLLAFRERRDALFPGLRVFYYEDLASDWEEQVREIQTLLGVTAQDLQPKTRKQNTQPIEEMVSNYQDLRDYFQGTPIEKWFTYAEAYDRMNLHTAQV